MNNKRYIIVVGDENAKYAYSLWLSFEYEDGTISEDTRIVETDDFEEFCRRLAVCLCPPSK